MSAGERQIRGDSGFVLPRVAWTAVCFSLGILLGSVVPHRPYLLLIVTIVWISAAWVLQRRRADVAANICLLLAVGLLGANRWQLSQHSTTKTIRNFVVDQPVIATVYGDVDSLPSVHVKPSTAHSPRLYGSPQQTRFQLQCRHIVVDGQPHAVGGRCQVYLDGDGSSVVSWGDQISLTGKIDWPSSRGNPGELDFARLLQRRQISGLMYVRHPDAIEMKQPVGRLHPLAWLNSLRREAQAILVRSVDRDVRPIAMALLLGERNQLPGAVEDAFIASGTMHLLAISGLHVGILCLFLLRLQNWLLVPRRRALLLTLLIAVAYAFVTDLRPSVVRATLFFAVFVAAQLLQRRQGMAGLIAVTALIMLVWQPHLVFETGAWLSFLSVAALGWVDARASSNVENNDVPCDAFTVWDRVREMAGRFWKWLTHRYLQMLTILALTTPIVATTFHVISPVGLIVNVLLIPATALVLCVGFVTMFVGLLVPMAASMFGVAFSFLLRALMSVVDLSSEIHIGHLYVADAPLWFVPAYYVLLLAAIGTRRLPQRMLAISVVFVIVITAVSATHSSGRPEGLRCTVLDVGHGSAAVLELNNGQTILIDAGAMNRGERAADEICSFLWHSGIRHLNAIIVSHADMDHYNAVPAIPSRIPVAELITSRQVARSDSWSVQAFLDAIDSNEIPIRVAACGLTLNSAGAQIRLLQADALQLPKDADDNAGSLVVVIEFAGRRIILPGDLEFDGAHEVLNGLAPTDVLVSPHHGATSANSQELAEVVQPQYVIVSARDAASLEHLSTVFVAAERIYHTSESGATTVEISGDGKLTVLEHRPSAH